MAVVARIIQAVLLLGAVVIGVFVIVNASTVFADAEDYCFIRPGQDTLPQSCAQLPRFQVQAISTGAMAIVGLSLKVGAVALNPYARGAGRPTPSWSGGTTTTASPWQPGPPTGPPTGPPGGPYGQPPPRA